jgi:hypothetical protein
MKIKRPFFCLLLSLFLGTMLYAQVGQTGSIRGVVLDSQKSPLPGATITVSSPALMGTRSVVTSADGTYRFPPILPPGEYTVTVELQGFNKIVRTGVIVRAGATVELNFEMTQAPLTEEVVVKAASPTVDVASPKVALSVTSEILQSLPLVSRTQPYTYALQMAAGTIGSSIHDSGPNRWAFQVDGVQSNAPDQNYPEVFIDQEAIEEIELVTGGTGADVYGAYSGYLNVITKSGGNEFHGSAQLYYTGKKLYQVLTTDEQLEALGLSKPTFPYYSWDASATLGGPVLKDKIWFFCSFKYFNEKSFVHYIPITIEGKYYGPYDRITYMPFYFGKLTYQINKNLKLFTMMNYTKQTIPHYYTGWNLTASASANNYPRTFNSSTDLTWMINSNNMLNARLGIYRFNWEGRYTEEADPSGPAYSDAYTGYRWGHRGMEEYTYKWIFNFNLKLIRFQDDFLGGDHEFQAGVEYARTRGDWGYWRQNPMNWTYYNGNRYYYRGLYGLNGPHPIYGDGSLSFATFGTKRGESQRVGMGDRYAFFIQDRMTIKNRLTINLGFRYDYIHSWIPEQVKGRAGGELAVAIGDYYILPYFGFNPYLELTYEGWDNCYPYHAPAPVIGITYDLFGDGKTAIKLNYGHYYLPAATGDWSGLHPSSPYTFSFYWWDLNGNGQPDLPPIDKYQLPPGTDPRTMLSTEFKQRIDPNMKNTYMREIIAQIQHELFPYLKVGIAYIFRDRKNQTAYLLYDRATGKYWNTLESAPEWYVPFKTIVPAYGSFPAAEVTVYYVSNNAPLSFTRLTNVPQQKLHYHGVELTFEKRMHNGWSLGGSFNYSYEWSNGGFGSPNARIYAEGRTGTPWWAKLYGTFQLPYGFLVSFFYTHTEGGYWGRTVSVAAPADWIKAHNVRSGTVSINVEPPDSRRGMATDNVNARIDKQFKIGNLGRLDLFVDISNLLGAIYPSVGVNPGGTWKPLAENTDQGTFTPGQMKLTGLSGTRSFRFSFRFSF